MVHVEHTHVTRLVINTLFNVAGVALSLSGIYLFFWQVNASIKRRWWPRYNVFGALLFVCFGISTKYLSARSPEGQIELVFFLIFLPLGTWIVCDALIKQTKFCDQCGWTVLARRPPIDHCPRCGAALKQKPGPDLLD